MKILCVSDYVDPLIYNQNVKEAFPDIDLILCAGDLPMDYIDFIVSVSFIEYSLLLTSLLAKVFGKS